MMSFIFCISCVLCWGQDSARVDRHHLQTVYVDAAARQRSLQSAAPLHVLNRKEMQTLGVTDMGDALHRIPGINLRDYGGAGGMKTVAVRGFGAQHTGVAYDGVMLTECQGGEIDVSRYSIDQVEALRLSIGDNDDIFITARQASVPAMLSIETMGERPVDRKAHVVTQVKYGSFGYVTPLVKFTQRLSRQFTLSAIGEYTYAENDYPFVLQNGTYQTKDKRTNSTMNSGHAELNIHSRISRLHQLWAKVYYYDNDRQLPGIARYYTNLSAETLRERNFFSQVRWLMRSHNDQWLMKLNAKYNWASSAYQDSLVAKRLNDATYWQREYYVSAALMWLATEHFTFDYSADYAFNNLNSTLATDNHPCRHTILQSLTAKYVGGKWVALARLLGSVYRHGVAWGEQARNMQRLSPSLSFSYHLIGRTKREEVVPVSSSNLYLRASYKDIFRVPTFNENYFFHYGSTNLNPEKTQQYNLGVTWREAWNEKLSVEMTMDAYLNRVRDKIMGVPYNMFVWRMVNLGKVDVKGLDVSVKASCDLSRHGVESSSRLGLLTISASYSYQNVANHTDASAASYGKQIAYVPYHSGSAAIGWENPWLCLSLHSSGMSTRWSNYNHYEDSEIPGYWEMGLTAYHTFVFSNRQLEIRGDVKNLLNKQYELVAHYPMPRRSWQLSLVLKM